MNSNIIDAYKSEIILACKNKITLTAFNSSVITKCSKSDNQSVPKTTLIPTYIYHKNFANFSKKKTKNSI